MALQLWLASSRYEHFVYNDVAKNSPSCEHFKHHSLTAFFDVLQMLSIYKPKGLKVVGSMSVVRNSIGSGTYIAVYVFQSLCVKVCRTIATL